MFITAGCLVNLVSGYFREKFPYFFIYIRFHFLLIHPYSVTENVINGFLLLICLFVHDATNLQAVMEGTLPWQSCDIWYVTAAVLYGIIYFKTQ